MTTLTLEDMDDSNDPTGILRLYTGPMPDPTALPSKPPLLEQRFVREDLPEKYQQFLQAPEDSLGGLALPMFCHPLYHGVYIPMRPVDQPSIVETIEAKEQQVAEALSARDFYSAVFTYERPYRADALARMAPMVPKVELGQLCGTVWMDSENIQQCGPAWQVLVDSTDGRDWMREDDLFKWYQLPDTFTVHRAEIDDGGWSWSLGYDTAMWFANRFRLPGTGTSATVVSKQVNKEDVFCFLDGRGEQEILILD